MGDVFLWGGLTPRGGVSHLAVLQKISRTCSGSVSGCIAVVLLSCTTKSRGILEPLHEPTGFAFDLDTLSEIEKFIETSWYIGPRPNLQTSQEHVAAYCSESELPCSEMRRIQLES